MGLKKELETVVAKIIAEFEKKQELYFEFWVVDDVTGVACFSNEYYFSLEDICHDVFTEQPKDQITDWQDDSLENEDEDQNINYQSYCKGLRFNNKEL